MNQKSCKIFNNGEDVLTECVLRSLSAFSSSKKQETGVHAVSDQAVTLPVTEYPCDSPDTEMSRQINN